MHQGMEFCDGAVILMLLFDMNIQIEAGICVGFSALAFSCGNEQRNTLIELLAKGGISGYHCLDLRYKIAKYRQIK